MWRTITGSRSLRNDFVQDHSMVRCGVGKSLSEVPLWSSLAIHAANIRSSMRPRFWKCIKLWGVFVQLCVHVCWDMSMNHDMHPMPGRKTEVLREISPVSRKRQQYFQRYRSFVNHIFSYSILVVLGRSYGIGLKWSVWRIRTMEFLLLFEACSQVPNKKP